MLSKEDQEKILQDLREMSVEEMKTILEKIGSKKLKPSEPVVPISKVLGDEMRHYFGPDWKED